MIKEIQYKLQGEGTKNEFDSWFIYYVDENRTIDFVTKDSEQARVDLSKVDLSNMTEQQRTDLIKILSI